MPLVLSLLVLGCHAQRPSQQLPDLELGAPDVRQAREHTVARWQDASSHRPGSPRAAKSGSPPPRARSPRSSLSLSHPLQGDALLVDVAAGPSPALA